MAGKIIADQIQSTTAGTLDTKYVVNGSAKAWSSFSFPSGSPISRDNLNISSITDVTTGVHDINFSNSFNTAEYAVTIGTWQSTNVTGVGNNLPTPTSSTQRIETRENNLSVDPNYVHVVFHGDLA